MKKSVLVALASLLSLSASAQDIIVKKDGTTITAKVTDIGAQEVKYKKWSNQDGPTYTIAVSELLAINYKNGEKDTFNSQPAEQAPSVIEGDAKELPVVAAPNNGELLSLYDAVYEPTANIKVDGKVARYCFVALGASSNSILSTKDIEMTLVRENEPFILGGETVTYYILLKNKTNRALYIDKANCFRTNSCGDNYCYFDQSIQTVVSTENVNSNNTTAVKATERRNGVVVNDKTRSTVVASQSVYIPQRVLVIPPGASVYLAENKSVDANGQLVKKGYSGVRQVEFAEKLDLSATSSMVGIPLDIVNRGMAVTFNEGDLPYSLNYSIRYSTSENFSTYSTLNAGFYIKEIIGCTNLNLSNPDKNIHGLNRYSVIATHSLR